MGSSQFKKGMSMEAIVNRVLEVLQTDSICPFLVLTSVPFREHELFNYNSTEQVCTYLTNLDMWPILSVSVKY